jgi:hypothetical protein
MVAHLVEMGIRVEQVDSSRPAGAAPGQTREADDDPSLRAMNIAARP